MKVYGVRWTFAVKDGKYSDGMKIEYALAENEADAIDFAYNAVLKRCREYDEQNKKVGYSEDYEESPIAIVMRMLKGICGEKDLCSKEQFTAFEVASKVGDTFRVEG